MPPGWKRVPVPEMRSRNQHLPLCQSKPNIFSVRHPKPGCQGINRILLNYNTRGTTKQSFAMDLELPITKENLYLVLWVEWKDGVVYRLASGEVIASEWESLDLEKVSLVLG
ncbi:hypothetical protein HZ326_29465 [Fusarium oxysporum f. sp. albedinis]|nr:hypothetical protein HZ326_29465 [Fusarium oxysporum f. sp. albedinis]